MIMKRIKCPKCSKYLLQGYGYAVTSITCTCGGYVELKNGKIVSDTGDDDAAPRKKKGRPLHGYTL